MASATVDSFDVLHVAFIEAISERPYDVGVATNDVVARTLEHLTCSSIRSISSSSSRPS